MVAVVGATAGKVGAAAMATAEQVAAMKEEGTWAAG